MGTLGLRVWARVVVCAEAEGSSVSEARLAGIAVRQDGRSASLTAPNGSAQRRLLLATLGTASLVSAQVGSVEAHGTGTALGDPTEAGSMAAVYLSTARSSPLSLGAAKANIGHSEAASGMLGVVRAQQVLRGARTSGNAHLRLLNPLIGERLRGVSGGVLVSGQEQALAVAGRSGVSSFGVSGTIAHSAISRIASVQSHPSLPLVFNHVSCSWLPPLHPLLQIRLPDAGTVAVKSIFRSSTLGALPALVADHVIQGRIVFPGAGYAEMAHAASNVMFASERHGALLLDILFVQPLVLPDDGQPPLWVECSLSAVGVFEVRSGDDDTALSPDVSVHCTCGMVGACSPEMWALLDLPAARECCTDKVAGVCYIYDEFYRVGLQYGPAFRALRHAWVAGDRCQSVAQMAQRTHLQGTHVHPADLDGSLQLTVLIAQNSKGETRVPFAIDTTFMRVVAPRHPWAVRSLPLLATLTTSQLCISLACTGG